MFRYKTWYTLRSWEASSVSYWQSYTPSTCYFLRKLSAKPPRMRTKSGTMFMLFQSVLTYLSLPAAQPKPSKLFYYASRMADQYWLYFNHRAWTIQESVHILVIDWILLTDVIILLRQSPGKWPVSWTYHCNTKASQCELCGLSGHRPVECWLRANDEVIINSGSSAVLKVTFISFWHFIGNCLFSISAAYARRALTLSVFVDT